MTKGEVIRRSVLLAKQAGLFEDVENPTETEPDMDEPNVESAEGSNTNDSGNGVRAVDVSQNKRKKESQKSDDTPQQSDTNSENKEEKEGWFTESEWDL
jgi:hypothetical protein